MVEITNRVFSTKAIGGEIKAVSWCCVAERHGAARETTLPSFPRDRYHTETDIIP